MTALQHAVGVAKGRTVRGVGVLLSRARQLRPPASYRPAVTVLIVNWNSLPYLRRTLAAVRAMSPADTEIVVVDNGSTDGSLEYLRTRDDVRTVRLPMNVGHGLALDLVVPGIDTEVLAILDVDAFPVSERWLPESIAALDAGAVVAGAHLHRNFVHPCFLVTRTPVLHQYRLTLRPVGSLAGLDRSAPLFLDVAEALSQRVIVKFGGGGAVHFFEITSARGPGKAGAVFGGLVYHNMYATQGAHQNDATRMFEQAFATFHPTLHTELS